MSELENEFKAGNTVSIGTISGCKFRINTVQQNTAM